MLKEKHHYTGILLSGLAILWPVTLMAQGAESVVQLEGVLQRWFFLTVVTVSLTVASFVRKNMLLQLFTFLAGAANFISVLIIGDFSLFSVISCVAGVLAWISVINNRRKTAGKNL